MTLLISKISTLIPEVGLARATFVITLGMLGVHSITFEQWLALVLVGVLLENLPLHKSKILGALPAKQTRRQTLVRNTRK